MLSKFKEGRVQNLITFFFKNKKMLNDFIHANQSIISEQLQNLVVCLPEILDFDSKRLLWRICIKKHFKRNDRDNDAYEIDLQVRRNHVFGDSFEQLKGISLESWK